MAMGSLKKAARRNNNALGAAAVVSYLTTMTTMNK